MLQDYKKHSKFGRIVSLAVKSVVLFCFFNKWEIPKARKNYMDLMRLFLLVHRLVQKVDDFPFLNSMLNSSLVRALSHSFHRVDFRGLTAERWWLQKKKSFFSSLTAPALLKAAAPGFQLPAVARAERRLTRGAQESAFDQ